MARIPLFQQQQLQSSRVGVPQQNNAGSQMAQSILGATQSQASGALRNYSALATEQNQTAQQNTNFAISQNAQAVQGLQQNLNYLRSEHNRKIDEQKRTEAALQAEHDNLDTARLKMEYGGRLEKIKNDIKATYPDQPEKASDIFDAQAKAELGKMLGEDKYNASVKSRALASTYGDVEAMHKDLHDWTFKKQTERQLAAVASDVDIMKSAKDIPVGDLEGLQQHWGRVQQHKTELWDKVVGAKGSSEAYKTAIEGSAKDYLSKLVNSQNPAQVEEQLKTGAFDSVLSDDEKAKFIKNAGQKIEADKRDAKDSEDKAMVGLKLKLMKIERGSDMDPRDPLYMKASIAAREELKTMQDEVAKQPDSPQNLRVLEALRTAINKQDGQIEKARNAVEAADAKQERLADRSEAKADREDAKTTRLNDARQAAADVQSAQIWKRQAEEKYNSQPAADARKKVKTLLYDLKNPEGLPNIRRMDMEPGKDGKPKPGVAQLSDFQLFNKVRVATDALNAAHDKGYLSIPGQSDKFYEDHIAYLGSITNRLADKQQPPAPPSPLEAFFGAKLKAAPDVVVKTFGQYPEVHEEYFHRVDSLVDLFTKQRHRQPTAEEIEKYIRPVATAKMLAGK